MTATHSGNSPALWANLRDGIVSEVETARTVLAQGDDRSIVSVARTHLARYGAVVVALMDEHAPDAEGNCSSCRGGLFGRKRVHAPCKPLLHYQLALTIPSTLAGWT